MSEWPSVRTHREICYAVIPGFRPLLLDLTIPHSDGPVPVVAYVHGGAFRVGTHTAGGNSLVRELTDELLPRGIALASVQYRLSGEARFPEPVHDVKAAVRWLKLNAGELGLDPLRVGAFGDSAGGYFATALATTAGVSDLDGELNPTELGSGIKAAVSWYGPTHLPTMPPLGAKSLGGTDPAASPESEFLGAVVASVPDLAEYASPVSHVTADAAPILLVHGTDDDGVPLEQSERLRHAYLTAGAEAELIVAPGGDHGFHTVDRSALLARSADFLQHRLGA
ncbi:alpha/beta hydrolase, partial [Nakamurella lactea]|uniref:alpha/beta hydrolase n=1 Tax=Nakamurella lactea TaxID=459515 RepID=UPI00056B4817